MRSIAVAPLPDCPGKTRTDPSEVLVQLLLLAAALLLLRETGIRRTRLKIRPRVLIVSVGPPGAPGATRAS